MREFCVGCALLFILMVIGRPKMKIEGFLGLGFILAVAYGLGYLVVDAVPHLIH